MAINTDMPIAETEVGFSRVPAAQFSEHDGEISLLDLLIVVARRKGFVLRATALQNIKNLSAIFSQLALGAAAIAVVR